MPRIILLVPRIRLVIALLTVLVATMPLAAAAPADTTPLLLTHTLVGRPVVTDAALAWIARDGDQFVLSCRDLRSQAQTVLAIAATPLNALVGDDTRLLWVEQAGSGAHVRMYDHATSTIATVVATQPDAALALDGATLYIADQRGLTAHDLTTGVEQLVSANGQRPAALGGALLWSEERYLGPQQPSEWRLLLQPAPAAQPIELAQQTASYGGFTNYTLVPGAALWAAGAAAADQRLLRYDIATGSTRVVAAAVDSFAASPGAVAWSTPQSAETLPAWVIMRRGAAGKTDVFAADRHVQVEALTARGVLASFDADGARVLYLLGPGDVLPQRPPQTSAVTAPCAATLADCGQVYANGAALADNGGPWLMRGVQFFHPRYGINGKTFWDANYASAANDGSLDFWLDTARSMLRANLLRLFVDLPRFDDAGLVVTPTSYATVYDMAQRAAQRDMRLGISLHNSADWALTPERAAWIGGLIDYFMVRDALPLIAYLNADNEINNHCGSGNDCFDSRTGYPAQAYVDGAIDWVVQFRALVKSRGPVLVTVGISSEVRDYDQARAAFDFFRTDSTSRTLASQVDFLSPHNYSGGAAGVIDDLRYNGYRGAIVLEEYGYPTDPYPRDSYWTEGPFVCRYTPLDGGCRNTAPFFVETNLEALRSRSYAGSAAWMLADVNEKNQANACTTQPSDLWTGLFANGGSYCAGGTYTLQAGAPKATAVRVCVANGGDLFDCDPLLAQRTQLALPLVSHR